MFERCAKWEAKWKIQTICHIFKNCKQPNRASCVYIGCVLIISAHMMGMGKLVGSMSWELSAQFFGCAGNPSSQWGSPATSTASSALHICSTRQPDFGGADESWFESIATCTQESSAAGSGADTGSGDGECVGERGDRHGEC